MELNTRQAILEKNLKTAHGRSLIASSMIGPLRQQRDYASVGRKAFLVDHLPNGALPYYDKDVDVTAYVVSEEGENIVTNSKGKRLLFPLFEIAANPEISLIEITNRRFDVIDRAIAKGTSDIMRAEDEKVFACIDALCDDPTAPNKDIVVTGNLTSTALAEAFSTIEEHDLRVAYVFCNAKDFADIRKWDRDTFDPESQGEILNTGVRSGIYGAKIVTSRVVPRGTIYITAEPEFFGRMPIRYDLTVLSADDPSRRMIGFSMFENIGIGLFNPYGAQRLKIVRSN